MYSIAKGEFYISKAIETMLIEKLNQLEHWIGWSYNYSNGRLFIQTETGNKERLNTILATYGDFKVE